jgi:DNA ligase-associated metallophosphoesterase
MKIEIDICGQHLLLLPERAVVWKQANAMIVADPHFGKAQVFRENGIPVPGGTTAEDIGRLSSLMERYRPDELIVLGDLMHGKISDSRHFDKIIDNWRQRWSRVHLTLVTGNHDIRAGFVPSPFQPDRIITEHIAPPFLLSHEPKTHATHYTIAGHLHPAVSIWGKGRQKETLPCFCFSEKKAILPAFGSFTGNHVIHPKPKEFVYVVAGHEVIKASGKK